MNPYTLIPAAALGFALNAGGAPVAGAAFAPEKPSPESVKCVECHKRESASIYAQWGASKHFRAHVGCYECHAAEKGDTDAFEHEGARIAVVVSPRDCARCHAHEAAQFAGSHHSKAGRILGSLDNTLAEVVEGNNEFVTTAFPGGVSAAAVNGCWQCHGTEIKVLPGGRLDPATWPNTGMGRINPDNSEGSCTACHVRHEFSVEQVRNPENCGRCHMGPDHPQLEIYNESKHGVAFRAHRARMNLGNAKWVLGEDYSAAPTCATCHMSATPKQGVTHDVGLRISWNNRPAFSVRPELSDAKMNLPGATVPWQTRRQNMVEVCLNCHNKNFAEGFYAQYDALLELYHAKFARPGQELMTLARPLLAGPEFSNRIDFTWYELWHHEGRRARHGASMMGPDYTHWHGTYEVARNFYSELIPELRELAQHAARSGDPAKTKAGAALARRLDEILSSPNHRWFIDRMDPAEAALRKRRQEEFKARYSK